MILHLPSPLFTALLGFRLLLSDGRSCSSVALSAPQIGLRNVAAQRRPNSSKWTANMQPAKISDTGVKKPVVVMQRKKLWERKLSFKMMVSSPINLTSFCPWKRTTEFKPKIEP